MAATVGEVRPEVIVGLLAEPQRLQVFAALVLAAANPAANPAVSPADAPVLGPAANPADGPTGGLAGSSTAAAIPACTPERLREVTGLDQRAVATALRKLEAGGLVEGDGAGGYRPVVDAFRAAARSVAPPAEEHGYADERVESVVRAFVRDGRLTGVPAQAGRRRVLLEHVVQSFEPGRDYSEKEVNVVLQAWSADSPVDHVALRRYLVDEGLLTRAGTGSNYRRSGGWLDVLGDQSLGTQGN